jgi:glycosyltransferase involved in cell wall biosynthesis
MKYPNIVFFRYEKYKAIDEFFETNKEKLFCNINITQEKEYLNHLFDPNYHLLITFGDEEKEYYIDVNTSLPCRMYTRWLHFSNIDNVNEFNDKVNFCYTKNCNNMTRVVFSIFTTCYKSYSKIYRAYNSIKNQSFIDWEWVILDDTPSENEEDVQHFSFLKSVLTDKRVRLYKRSDNSGSIGNVKNEAVMLCRGKYVLEMDHDDEIVYDLLEDTVKIFERDETVGFVYSDFTNIYENGANFSYGNFFGLGYEGYYCKKYNGRWVYVCSTANINNITLSHIVSVPNHARIWRKDVLMELGNYCEFLPIADDYHILVKTALKTKMVKLHKLGYIQYMNENNNNFSLIRNAEINRLVPFHLKPHFYIDYNINEEMKKKDAYENEIYLTNSSQIWKRGDDYKHTFCNEIANMNYVKIYCIIGLENMIKNIKKIKELYNDPSNDFLILENKMSCEDLCHFIDNQKMDRMKCYSMNDCNYKELEKYFHLIYKSLDNYEIIV